MLELGGGEMNDPLKEVQKRFCLIDLDGQRYVLDRKQIDDALKGKGTIKYYKRPEGALSIERFIEASSLSLTNTDIKNLLYDYWRSPNTLEYQSVAFHPKPQGEAVLNFWRGHSVTPKEGKYGIIGDFLVNVICSGNQNNYQWLAKFLAHMLQKPEEKPTVAIILLGGQGVGKGMFYRLLKTIWPHTMLQVHDIDDVVGKFTASLERSYGVWLDEALFTHDRKSMEKLKAVISEPTIRIEEKYEPKRTITSIHRIIAASNNDHFANIQGDDRRFFILRVSDCHQQDHAYFAKYLDALDDGISVPALVHALLAFDISSFNVHLRPKTAEHGQQKILSLDGFQRFYYEALQSGEKPSINTYNPSEWYGSFRIATKDLKEAYLNFDKNANKHRPVIEGEISQKIKAMCPSTESVRWQDDNRQVRGLKFPPLEEARKEFDDYIEFTCDWDN